MFNFKSCPITYSARRHWLPWQQPSRNQSTPADQLNLILLEWSNKNKFYCTPSYSSDWHRAAFGKVVEEKKMNQPGSHLLESL